jgi:asparagine synthetase B (glutamine-hydrolysing)
VLQFNGELYNGDIANNSQSDTTYLFDLLKPTECLKDVIEVTASLLGEFAFVYTAQTDAGTVIYAATDCYGRRSLQMSLGTSSSSPSSSAPSSSSPPTSPTSKCFVIGSDLDSSYPGVTNMPASRVVEIRIAGDGERVLAMTSHAYAPSVAAGLLPAPPTNTPSSALRFLLTASLQSRLPAGEINLFYSGGIDCHLLLLLLLSITSRRINLLNVQFGDALSPDRVSAYSGYLEVASSHENVRLLLVDRPHPKDFSSVQESAWPNDDRMDFNISHILRTLATSHSVPCRAFNENYDLPLYNAGVSMDRTAGDGGVASKGHSGTINYARRKCNSCYSRTATSDCFWVNVCAVCCANLGKKINRFIGGRSALCDAHANGGKNQQGTKKKQQSAKVAVPAKDALVVSPVFLSGLGADELFGGYGRHRTAFLSSGYAGVRQVLDMELDRLWDRNLQRDDRAVGGVGCEVRYPFLDERVVMYTKSLDVTDILDFDLPQGVGDKKILRDMARELGGGDRQVGRIKRAMQFGTRIVKGEKLRGDGGGGGGAP